MKKYSKIIFVILILISVCGCKDKSPEGKLAREEAEIEKEYAEADNESNVVKAFVKRLKTFIKEEDLKETVQNFNDVIGQIEEGGSNSIRSIVDKISDVFYKLLNEEEVDKDTLTSVYGLSSALALFEDEYDNEPVLELCDEFNEYLRDLIKGEDTTEKAVKIKLYLGIIDSYSNKDYEELYNKIINK